MGLHELQTQNSKTTKPNLQSQFGKIGKHEIGCLEWHFTCKRKRQEQSHSQNTHKRLDWRIKRLASHWVLAFKEPIHTVTC